MVTMSPSGWRVAGIRSQSGYEGKMTASTDDLQPTKGGRKGRKRRGTYGAQAQQIMKEKNSEENAYRFDKHIAATPLCCCFCGRVRQDGRELFV